MRKQSGFTLIELMVVMAIIAILATAGLSAYTGYIKKARDTKRIADIAAINTIVLANMSTAGLPPTVGEIVQDIKDANNGQRIVDPLTVGTTESSVCSNTFYPGSNGNECRYVYFTCDDGVGYMLGAFFESSSNLALYTENGSGFDTTGIAYDIGKCTDYYTDIVLDLNL